MVVDLVAAPQQTLVLPALLGSHAGHHHLAQLPAIRVLMQFQRNYLGTLNDDVAAAPSFNVTFRRRP